MSSGLPTNQRTDPLIDTRSDLESGFLAETRSLAASGRRSALRTLGAGALAFGSASSRAQDDKSTINVFVGASASMDICARLVSEQLRESLGRTTITVPKLGAGQRVAMGEVRRSAPDGRNLVFVTNGPFCIYPHVYKKLDYDPVRDFTPIIGVSKFDVAIATGPATGVTSLKDLITWVKARNEDTIYASAPGNGSFSHFVGIATALTTSARLTHVPYKDSGQAVIDLGGGRIPIMLTGMSSMLSAHQAGKIRILAVSGAERSPLLPDVPTLRESGVNVARSTYTGVFGPAGMAPDLVKRLHDAIAPMLTNAAVVDRLRQHAMTMAPATGAQLAETMREEFAYFGGLAKDSGYVPTEG